MNGTIKTITMTPAPMYWHREGYAALVASLPHDGVLLVRGREIPIGTSNISLEVDDTQASLSATVRMVEPSIPENTPTVGPAVLGWLIFVISAWLWRKHISTKSRLDWPVVSTLKIAALGAIGTMVTTWPMIWPSGALVQANADAYGSVWLLGGAIYKITRVDTVLLMWAGAALEGLASPVDTYHWLSMAGVFLSFMAAEQLAARTFSVPRPWSAMAGAVFAFNPLVGTAIAEGHGGLLFAFGLPLLLAAVARPPDKHPWPWALSVVVATMICTLASGYFGVLGAIMVLCWGGQRWATIWRIMLIAALPVLVYIREFKPFAQTEFDGVAPEPFIGALDLLAGVPRGADEAMMHIRYPLLFSVLILGIVLPWIQKKNPKLLFIAAVAVVLSMGHAIQITGLDPTGPWISKSPLSLLTGVFPSLAQFRFTYRFLWLYFLCASIGVAQSLAWMCADRRRQNASFLLAAVVIGELMFFGAKPTENRRHLATIPSAYAALTPQDTVLDIWPQLPQAQATHQVGINCFYQTGHKANLAHRCLGTDGLRAAAVEMSDQVVMSLLNDLEIMKVEATVFAIHKDGFTEVEANKLLTAAWGRFGAPISQSHDGGESIYIFRLRGEGSSAILHPN